MFEKYSFGDSSRVVLLFTGWKTKIVHFWLFARILRLSGFQVIVYVFSSDFLSSDTERTSHNFENAKREVSKDIKELKKKENVEISVFGVSLGTVLALMVANSDNNIHNIVLNLSGYDLAEAVWSWGDRLNEEFYQTFKAKNLSLNDLKKAWFSINPKNNIDRIINRNILLYIAEQDEIIPFTQGGKLKEELERKNQVRIVINSKNNHFMSAAYNMFIFPLYIKALSK